jgi:uncharacterized protein (DUF433 family)
MPTVLEDYFDFSDPEEIRIQGHRVYLHHVLMDYRDRKRTVEQICDDFGTLSKDKVFACLTYYHRNREELDRYLDRLNVEFARQRDESLRKNGNWLAELRARHQAMQQVSGTPT